MDNLKHILNTLDHWDIYNSFFLMSDIDRLRKFLVRSHLFQLSLNVPGDIVELGVFKGIGIAQLLKLREIYTPGSDKKIIGFDLFSDTKSITLNKQDQELNQYYKESGASMTDGISKTAIDYFISQFPNHQGSNRSPYELIEGDVSKTLPDYLEENPGFRASFVHLDLDLAKPTYDSLACLYPRIVRGGIIVLDDYASDKWTESNGVDQFLQNHKELELKALSWAKTPSAYIVKP